MKSNKVFGAIDILVAVVTIAIVMAPFCFSVLSHFKVNPKRFTKSFIVIMMVAPRFTSPIVVRGRLIVAHMHRSILPESVS